MSEIKEWQQFTQADIRNANLSNCSKCGELIDFAHIKNNEVVCEDCYFGIPKGKKKEKKEGVVYTAKGQSHCEKCYYQQIKDRREQYQEEIKQELSKEYPKKEKKILGVKIMEIERYKTITKDEVKSWCTGTLSNWAHDYLLDILTGEYSLTEARRDILSFREEEEEEEEEKKFNNK